MDRSNRSKMGCLGRQLAISSVLPLAAAFAAVLLVYAKGTIQLQLLLVSLLVSALLALFLAALSFTKLLFAANQQLKPALLMSGDKEVFGQFQTLSQSLLAISGRGDQIFRSLALEQLNQLVAAADRLAEGKIVYRDTETWRIAYDTLLRSPGLYQYHSVAWIKHAKYWRDFPGQQSMATNFELVEDGRLNITRMCILNEKLWPPDSLPTEKVLNWVSDQHFRGIVIGLVREEDLRQEPELLMDYGIYGYRAVGTQTVDERGHTTEFQLSFDFEDVERYERFWERLQVYSINLGQLLDRASTE